MVVHPDSGRISRFRPYSGTLYCASVFRRRGSHPLWPPVPGTFAYTKDVRYRGPTTPAPPPPPPPPRTTKKQKQRKKKKKKKTKKKKGRGFFCFFFFFFFFFFFPPEGGGGPGLGCSLFARHY